MSNEERFAWGTCAECGKEVKPTKEAVLLCEYYQGYHYSGYRDESAHCLHKGKCLRGYKRKWLTGREAINRGYILGICYHCGKPIRDKELYIAKRLIRMEECDEYSEYLSYVTIPIENEVVFQHKECLDKWRNR